ncbi:hypothetical protein SLS56_002165 [Neofusicoccum ribis]|uniref:Ankyrin repeat protein n=1 Tax=Neofusicoccum ribis TaxID=45134 RepID=A0ABR3T5A7_9PEZI
MHKVATKELVASFFIHGRGFPLQKTLIGLYRALLSALLGHFPDHISQLTERVEEKERQFGSYERQKWEWNESELQKFLFSFLLKASTSRHVVIYIDALDECGAETAQKLLAYLRQLIASAEQQGSHVRICFSSRHYPILGLENVPTIYVEDRNDQDIRRVVRNGLQDIDSSKRHQIENEIVAKAQGGFQWAVLVLDKAVQLNRRGINAQTIHEEISAIPAELNQLYSDLINISDAHERQQTKKLFQWVLCAQRPLKIEELREALAIDADAAYASITDLRASKDYCDSVPDAERRIKDLSRGLIEIRERKVLAMVVWDENAIREAQFIHQSVADFLIRNGQTAQDLFASAQTPLGIGHSEISRSCSLYLGLDEILGAAERSWYYFKDEFPLASYAADYMFQHLQIAKLEGFPQFTALNRLQQWTDGDGTFDRTLQLWNTLTEGSKSFVPYSDEKILRRLIESHVDMTGALNYALELTAPRRMDDESRKVWRLLVYHANVSYRTVHRAVEIGLKDLVEVLSEHNVSPNPSATDDELKDTPLLIAIRSRSVELVQALATYRDLEVNAAIARLLDFEKRDEEGRAVEVDEADVELVRLLIHHPKSNVNKKVPTKKGSRDMSMLTAAVYYKRARTIELLLESDRTNVDCRTSHSPLFPYQNAPDYLKNQHPSSQEIKDLLQTFLIELRYQEEIRDVAPLVINMDLRQSETVMKIVSMLLETGKISETSIVDAYFVALSFGCTEVMGLLRNLVSSGRQLYEGGQGRGEYEIWIGPAPDSELSPPTMDS